MAIHQVSQISAKLVTTAKKAAIKPAGLLRGPVIGGMPFVSVARIIQSPLFAGGRPLARTSRLPTGWPGCMPKIRPPAPVQDGPSQR